MKSRRMRAPYIMRMHESSRRVPYRPKRETAPMASKIKPEMYLLESEELDSVRKSINSFTVMPEPQMKTM